MANLASSSIDDQQERHFIGDLLLEEDVFGQPNSNRIDAGTGAQLQSGGVLAGAGPIGPTPNQTFWPEPPPPYSPYTAVPPQWTSLNRPPGGMLAPPVAGLFGQSPTATAVTRTDFYQTPFNAGGEWDAVTGAPLDAYLSVGSPIPYSSHPGMPVLKPMMPAGGTMNTVQHMYHNMCRHHHQSVVSNHHHFGGPPNVLAHGGSTVSPLGSGYHTVEQPPPPLLMDPISPHRILGKPSRKQSASLFHYEFSGDSTPTSPGAQSGGALPCGGKTYSDAASNKQRIAQQSSAASNTAISTVRHTSSSSSGSSGTPLMGARKITGSQRNTSERHSSGDSALENAAPLPSKEKAVVVGLNPIPKTNAPRKRTGENEFQKIIHKKKGGKGTKNEPQVVADEDGRASAQVVDASSRFDVLQSLGGQPVPVESSARLTRRSLSSGTPHDSSRNSKDAKPIVGATVSPGRTEWNSGPAAAKNISDELFGTHLEEGSAAAVKVATTTSQRPVGKKVCSGSSRREQGEQNILETPRVSVRKHRAVPRKRQSTTVDYLNFVLLAVFSLAKRAAQWILDLLVDISLQLKDVAVYGTLATYSSVTLSCQRCWYFLLEKLRLFWNKICSLDPRKVWISESNDRGTWGLNENIQLPITGDEAMERLLRCHGQDAFVVLGLRADCSDENIRRYYKRQAVLVHPDKNHSSGADEAFKILSRAFEAIGTPEARLKYNLANLHKNPLHQEMEELWTRLREKMNEARNTMHCDCGSKHTRVPVLGIRAQEARYCKKCAIRHPAKHNDIWAETRFGGFWWVYYACLDGVVYDITQWATCPNNRLKHMKANSHAVQYRLISTAGPSGNKGDTSSKRSKKSHHSQQDSDEFDCMDGGYGGGTEGNCGCSISTGGLDGSAASQQASYRPPERRALDADRPRRAGRRRKLR